MARINTYATDNNITDQDKWIGTDFNGNVTKNFTPEGVANWINSTNSVGIAGQSNFKFQTDLGTGRQNGTISFNAGSGDGTLFSTLNNIKISKYGADNNLILDFLQNLVGTFILLCQVDDTNNFGVYRLDSLIQDEVETEFYNAVFTVYGSNGALQRDEYYGVVAYPGSNIVSVTGLEAIDEGNGFGWRLIGRDPDNYGNIGINAIDFSNSDSISTEKGSVGNSSITFGYNNINESGYSIVTGQDQSLKKTNLYSGSNFVGGYNNFIWGVTYNSIIYTYRSTVNVEGSSFDTNVVYQCLVMGDGHDFYAGRDSGAIGGGLISGSTGCFTVGIANEDLTTTTSTYITNYYNNYGPRFIVGCGTYTPTTGVAGVRQNGFVVMSDGAATFPVLSNAMIDAAGDDSAVTKGWVNAQATEAPTGLEAIDEGNGTGWRLIGRDAANYGNLGAGAIDFSDSNTISTVNGSTGVGAVTFGYNSKNPLKYSIVSGFEQNISITSDLYADGIGNLIAGERNTIYNNNWNNIISGYLNTVGTEGAVLTSLGPIVYDSIIQGTRNEVYASRDSLYVGRGLTGGSRGVTVVGHSNVDLTTSVSDYTEASINAYGPRFIVGVGTWSGTSSGGSVGTRANGFVVMSDGTATFPSLTNVMIDSAGADSAVTKGWVLAQTDVNTTYDLASTQNGTDVDVTLTGSDATVDTVKLVAGANIVLTDNGASEITIDAIGAAETAERIRIEVKNTSGVTLTKGTPVYITGTVGATARVQVAAADASDPTKMPAVGVLSQDLINNADGFATTGGFINNVTTDPIDGLTPVANQTVYVKPGGGLTLTKPINGNLIQNIAKVGKISGGNAGSLVVSSILRTNDVPNLTNGKIWVGTPTYTSESTVVHLDESNGRMGIGTTSPASRLEVQGGATLSAIGFSGPTVKIGDYTGIGTTRIFSDGSYIGYSTANSYHDFSNAGASQMRITSTGNVGIGTTSPSNKLSVYGSTRIDQSADWDGLNIYGFDDQAADYIKIHIGTTPMARYQSNLPHSFYVGNSKNLDIYATSVGFSVDSTHSDDLVSIFGTNKDSYLGYSNTDDKFKIGFGSLSTPTVDSNTQLSLDGSGVYVENNLGVGTATPAAKLDVNGGIRMADDATAASALNVGTLRYRSDANNSYVDMSMQTGASTYAWVNIVQNNW